MIAFSGMWKPDVYCGRAQQDTAAGSKANRAML
jgi:hypothetical protein